MGWKWEHSENTTTLPVDFCRDLYIFDMQYVNSKLSRIPAEDNKVIWQRTDDKRCFLIPIDIINQLPNNNLFRDIIACISQMYLDDKCPNSNVIITSIRKLADNIGIAINGEKSKEIEDVLRFARLYTIYNQSIRKIQNGKIIQCSATFGFIESVVKETQVDGKQINSRLAKNHIKLNDIYAGILRESRIPKAPIPVSALQAANRAKRKLITPSKNLIYRLAALVPPKKPTVEFSIVKLREVIGYRETRKDRLKRSIENVLEVLYPVMIRDYIYEDRNQKYIITLSGSLNKYVKTI